MKDFKDGCYKKIKMHDDYYLLFHENDKFLYYMSKSKLIVKKRKERGLATRTDTISNSVNVTVSKTDWKKFDFQKIYDEKFTNYVARIYRKDTF